MFPQVFDLFDQIHGLMVASEMLMKRISNERAAEANLARQDYEHLLHLLHCEEPVDRLALKIDTKLVATYSFVSLPNHGKLSQFWGT